MRYNAAVENKTQNFEKGWAMLNINKLKGKIVEKGMSVSKLAEVLEIDKATLYRKLSAGGEPITVGEANRIANALELTSHEAVSIFFASCVARRENMQNTHARRIKNR